jgi:Mg2+/Co2+ transporter CorB
MDGSFWVGIGVFVAIAALTVLVLVIVRILGKRMGPEPPGSHEARIEAEQLREQSRRDGWIP